MGNEMYIDIKDGLARVMGNSALYANLLRGAKIRELTDDLLIALDVQDSTRARFAVHRLKGVAANLSLNVLCRVSTELEELIISDGDVKETAAELKVVATATLTAIKDYLEGGGDDAGV